LQRKGGCAIKKDDAKLRLSAQTGWLPTPFSHAFWKYHFRATTPSAPFNGCFAKFSYWRSHLSSVRRGLFASFTLLGISAGSGVGILKRLEYMSKEFRKWLVHDRYGRARKHDRKGTWRSAESQSWRTFPWSRGEIQRLEQSGLSKISAGDASAGLTTPPDHKPR
jgi:hypothetical protein